MPTALYQDVSVGGEEWRPVVGFEGRYEVSNLGRVRTLGRAGVRSNGQPHTVRPLLRKLRPNPDGYLVVGLTREGRNLLLRVHRLVLEAFVGPCPDGHETRHLDGVRTNNALPNLAWGTDTENSADKARHGTVQRGAAKRQAKLRESDIPAIREAIASGRSHRKVARDFGVSPGTIRQIIRGDTWTHV
jgi:hypothetical protein